MDSIKAKKTLTEETYDILVDAICSGELAPGERLTQEELATRLNVSRQPVNGAISILKSTGLIEDVGRRGVVVAALNPDLFFSICEYRKVIEPFVARLASQRRGPRARAEGDALMKIGRAAVTRRSVRALVDADMQFHQAIYDWAGNAVIAASMQVNWYHIRRMMTWMFHNGASPCASWDDHAVVIAAICAGDGDAAAQAMEGHISHAYAAYVDGVPGLA